jgi:L-fuculose-phosphate aldolase
VNEKELRGALVAVARRLDDKGILTATDGNLSALCDDGTLLVTPTGCCKGLVQEEELVAIRPDGTSTGRPTSEIALHRAIYAVRDDVKAIVHAHPPFATAYAVAGIALDQPILSEAVLTLGDVRVAPYSLPTAVGLAESVAPHVGKGHAVLLRFHGAVTYGNSIAHAGLLMETLEHVTKIDTIRRLLGSDAKLSEEETSELEALRQRLFGW